MYLLLMYTTYISKQPDFGKSIDVKLLQGQEKT